MDMTQKLKELMKTVLLLCALMSYYKKTTNGYNDGVQLSWGDVCWTLYWNDYLEGFSGQKIIGTHKRRMKKERVVGVVYALQCSIIYEGRPGSLLERHSQSGRKKSW